MCFFTGTWPPGQAVKTPPSHGGIRGSIPLGVISLKMEERICEYQQQKC